MTAQEPIRLVHPGAVVGFIIIRRAYVTEATPTVQTFGLLLLLSSGCTANTGSSAAMDKKYAILQCRNVKKSGIQNVLDQKTLHLSLRCSGMEVNVMEIASSILKQSTNASTVFKYST